jgi:hypothetical protein
LGIVLVGVVVLAAWHLRTRQQLAARHPEGCRDIATENERRRVDRGVFPPRFVEPSESEPRGTEGASGSSTVKRLLNETAWVRVPTEAEQNARLARLYERKEAAALGALSGLDLTPEQFQQVTDLIRSSLAKEKAARQRPVGARPPGTLTDFLSQGEAAIGIETERNRSVKRIIGAERTQKFALARNALFWRSYDGQDHSLR